MKLSNIKDVLNAEIIGQDCEFSGVSIDTRTIEPNNLFIAIEGEKFDGHQYIEQALKKGAKAVMMSKRQSLPENTNGLVVSDTIKALGQLAKCHRDKFDLPIIAITGSCGKTSVRSMVYAILSKMGKTLSPQANYNNHIGVPLTLLRLDKDHKYAVIEMGASGRYEVAYMSNLTRQSIGLINNVHKAHLEGFKSEQGIAESKAEIYQGLGDDGVAILNLDSQYKDYFREKIGHRKTITFGLQAEAMIHAVNINNHPTGCHFKVVTPQEEATIQLCVPGKHQVSNALAAIACVYSLNIPMDIIQTALSEFQGVEGRMKAMALGNKITLIDDTYNANPGSFKAAIEYLKHCPNQSVLVMGDMGELGTEADQQHLLLGTYAKEHGVKRLFATGPLSKLTVQTFGKDAIWFEDKNALIEELKAIPTDATILVKGSRFMQMDAVIDALKPKEH